ncbi:MAG: hypothetical protein BWY61_01567 [Firmicutes bacterium ADurb.Bin354]|nr:MAG: hypothetical protein BWY61_01567 [Firmicutes bacterium ADurb.Bin354]
MILELVIQMHNIQDIEQLPLIFVQTLNLYVKYGSGIDINSVMLLDIFCKANFVLILDIHELALSLFIISINLELLDL